MGATRSATHDIVVIGGSAGAVEGVATLVRGLPADLPAAVFVVVHFPTDSVSVLPQILARAGPLPAHHAVDGEEIRNGQIYVAVPGCHLELQRGKVRTRRGPKENGHRPAIDPLFRTAAEAYGPRVVGVILSGNLTDGTAGLQAVKRRGGKTLVQDPAGLAYQSMPRSAIENVPVDRICPLHALAPALVAMVREPAGEVSMSTNEDGASSAEREVVERDRSHNDGVPSTYTCPECHGTLWEVRDESLLAFRCRVGHAYSADALYTDQNTALEAALWTALRSLEEHAALCRRMAAKARDRGHDRSDALFTEKAIEAERHAALLREAVLDDDSPIHRAYGRQEPEEEGAPA
jgi:two-component system, chemotaxis family, protein-glutamate methylesterase/glutaminase